MSNDITIFNSFDLEDEEIEIQAGQYWILKNDYNYPKGTVLLIESLNIIDNLLHSIQLAKHPVKKPIMQPYTKVPSNHHIMYENFLDNFEFIPLDEALRIREEEIKEEQQKIDKAREDMLIGYVDKTTGENASILIANITSQDKSKVESLPMEIGGDVESYKARALQIEEIANKQKEFILDKKDIITKASTNLASYYQEKGTQALASVDSTMKYVAKLTKGIHTLGLYTGQGVRITQLAKGKEAPVEEKLTFYQRKLYFDEETFFELKDGGADYNSMEEFIKELETNFSVIKRMIPSPRGVVMVQYRRKGKEYFTKEDYERNPFLFNVNDSMNDGNKVRFLLVRNGENVHKVDCHDFFEAERLFPTAVEMNSFFRKNHSGSSFDKFNGVDFGDGKISANDLQYVEARDKHDSKAIFYKRVLIVLSGIQSRDTKIIGNFDGASQYIGKWYNFEFQKSCCVFVHDDEDGLDFQLKPISEWLDKKNAKALSGSRIMCNTKKMMNTQSSPMAVTYFESDSRGHYHRQGGYVWYYTPFVRFETNIALNKNNSLFVRVECKPTHNSRGADKGIYVELDKANKNSFIVLDDIKKDEIQLYLNSRKAREDYLDYAELLLEAKKEIEKDELEQAEFVSAFQEHILKLYSSFERMYVLETIDESIRLFRATNGGKNLPKIHDEDYSKTVASISKIIHTLLNANDISKKIIKAFNETFEDKDVIKVVISNTSDYLLYVKVKTEFKIFESESELFEAEQYKVTINKDKIKFSFKGKVFYDDFINERTLFTKGYQANKNITLKGLSLFNGLKASLEESSRIFNDILYHGGIKLEDTKKLLKKYLTKNKNTKRYYKRMSIEFTVAMFGAKSSRNAEDHSIFKNKGKSSQNGYAVLFGKYLDVGSFITDFGNDESFEYLFNQLTAIRFNTVAVGFKKKREEYEYQGKTKKDLLNQIRLTFSVYSLNENLNKLPSQCGFSLGEHLEGGSSSKHGFPRIHDVGEEVKNLRTVNDYKEFFQQELLKPLYTYDEYKEEILSFDFEEIAISEFMNDYEKKLY